MRTLLVEIADFSAASDEAPGGGSLVVELQVGNRVYPAQQISDNLWLVEVDEGEDESGADIDVLVANTPIGVDSAALRHSLATRAFTLIRPGKEGVEFLDPATRLPMGDAYEGRARLTLVDQLPPPRLGGRPGKEPLPVNAVAHRVRSTYLSPQTHLNAGPDRVAGELLEFESVWEPLGWAFDEWISTSGMPPGADARDSAATVASEAAMQDRAAQEERDRIAGSTLSTSDTDEHAETTARQRSSSQGFQAGIGRQTSTGATLTFDPIAALTSAVTGAVQIGYSASSATGSTEATAGLERAVRTSVNELAERVSAVGSQSLSQAKDAYHDTRIVRAFRNPWWGATENVGEFSLVRQWRVTTVLARRRGVVFVPIHELDAEFTARDVFLYRDVLQSVLLDPTLADELDSIANDYDPGRADDTEQVPLGSGAVVTFARISANTANRIAGLGAKVRVVLQFKKVDYTIDLDGKTKGVVESAATPIGQPLSELLGWTFRYEKPLPGIDNEARLEDVAIEFTLQDGDHVEQQSVTEGTIHLKANKEEVRGRGLQLPTVSSPLSAEIRQRSVDRLKCHLDAYRNAYRLAIDLVTDPVTRASRLSPRVEVSSSESSDASETGTRQSPVTNDPLQPQDLRPVGVAGTHLAFLNGADGGSGKAPPIIQQLVTTPETGTYFDVVPGHVCVGDDFVRDSDPPRVVLPDKVTFSWPEVVSLERLTRTTPVAGGTPPSAPEAATASASELGTSIANAITALGTLGDALKAADESAKQATPTTPTPTSPPPGAAGTPAAGTPAAGTPAAGTPAAGTPAAGTPAAGGAATTTT